MYEPTWSHLTPHFFLPESPLFYVFPDKLREKSNMEMHSRPCYAVFTNLDARLLFLPALRVRSGCARVVRSLAVA